MRSHLLRVILLPTLLMLMLATIAHADGVYMPQRAYPAMPSLPAQSAIILYRNNTETLIVESAFQTDAPSVAWILPLPAPPTALESADPGIITSATFALQPIVHHDLHGLWTTALLVFLLTLPFALNVIFTRDLKTRRSNAHILIAVEVLFFCLLSILLPSLGKAGTGPTVDTPGIALLSAHRLEDADFSVLTATDPAALNDWLVAHEMKPLDAAAVPIVADYIARHWCFVVGTFHPDHAGTQVPRPLVASFPATSPVFPMKLTALAGTTTHVELIVVSDKQASADDFRCLVADRFVSPPSSGQLPDREGPYYVSAKSNLFLGSPDLQPLLWPGCVITRLSADLAPIQMRTDISLQLTPLTPRRATFYTTLSLQQLSITLLFIILTLTAIAAAFLWHGRRQPSTTQLLYFRRAVGACLLMLPALWLLLPTIPVRAETDYHSRWQARTLLNAANILAQDGALHPNMTPEQIASIPQLLREKAGVGERELTNPYTGQRIRRERSPGNFDLRLINNKPFFCAYDQYGIERRTSLLPADLDH